MIVPGIGQLIATAIEALAPPFETFRSRRDSEAMVGLIPVQSSIGGPERPVSVSGVGRAANKGGR
ncbi:transposase [Methylobacterium fujisawaense]|uniref:transposase n=1 Tax=Methylobacterium fujisawaense TaxID=107400 RepID=UPI002F356222